MTCLGDGAAFAGRPSPYNGITDMMADPGCSGSWATTLFLNASGA
jgi:hypothetical protein